MRSSSAATGTRQYHLLAGAALRRSGVRRPRRLLLDDPTATSASLGCRLGGVVDCVNPLGFDAKGAFALAVPEGSAAEQAASLLPDSRVVAAFHHVSASAVVLEDPEVAVVDTDVMVLERTARPPTSCRNWWRPSPACGASTPAASNARRSRRTGRT